MTEWQKPELVVLVRHEPQEAVLQGCKVVDGPFGGQGTSFGDCDWTEIVTGQCSPEPCSLIITT